MLSPVYEPGNLPLEIESIPGWQFDYGITYYLAGPMSGYPEYNYPEFTEACTMLRLHGIDVQSPHEIEYPDSKVLGDLPYQRYIEGGMKLLAECDGIILLPGWPQSTGALMELKEATDRNLPVYFLHPYKNVLDGVLMIGMNRRAAP